MFSSLWTSKPKYLHTKNGALDARIRGEEYLWFMPLTENTEKPPYSMSWEQDLNVTWDASTWYSKFQKSFKSIANVSLIEANTKILTLWYNVLLRMAKNFPGTCPLCFRGCGMTGSLFHIWWECPCIRGLWNRIFSLLRKVTSVSVSKTPEIAGCPDWTDAQWDVPSLSITLYISYC